MPSTPHVISGKVFQNDGTTALEGISVTVINKSTGESHNGNDAGFEDLITNSSGEYSTNLGSYTTTYSNADSIESSASHATHGKDTGTTTVNTNDAGEVVNLVLSNDDVLGFTELINTMGQTIDHRRTAATYEEGTVETEVNTDTTMTMVFDLVSDERRLMSWGEVKTGEAVGFFKGKEDIQKGDLIRVPRSSGDWWKIDDTPRLFRITGGQASHWEAKLIRIT